MCCGSAARRSRCVEAADHALAQVRPVIFFFYWGGGGVVRLTAKPRYLLLLHRGDKKSNTVTALVQGSHASGYNPSQLLSSLRAAVSGLFNASFICWSGADQARCQ